MRRIAWLAGFAVLAALPARAQETVTDFTLDNGMQVVVVEDHRAPVVTHMVWYRAGSADEPAGKSGIAHFLEHLMFKQTENLAPGEFSKVVSQKNLAVGKILRLTVSAIVDGSQIYPLDGSVPEFEARPESEMKKIEDLIKDAVGFVEKRD